MLGRILTLLVAWVCLPVWADGAVWEVSHQGNRLYLGGTVHLMAASDLPFPEVYDRVYAQADLLVLETDLGAFSAGDEARQLRRQLQLPDGVRLEQRLSGPVYAQLRQLWQARGYPEAMFQDMTPAGVMLTLVMLELRRQGIDTQGPDLHYYLRATAEQKPVAGLEPVAEHIHYLASLGQGQEDELMRQTLNELPQLAASMQAIVAAWKAGDEQALEALVLSNLSYQLPGTYDKLLLERNRNWLPRLEQMLATPEKELVLVGVAHLVGRDGLLQALRLRGYRVEKVR